METTGRAEPPGPVPEQAGAALRAAPAGLSSAEAGLRQLRRARSPAGRVLCRFASPPSTALVLAGLLVWQRPAAGVLILVAAVLLAGWAAWALPPAPAPAVTALRDGRAQPVPISELVRGDLLTLTPGQVLPTDLSIVEDRGLELDGGPVAGAVVLAGTGTARVTHLPEPEQLPPEVSRLFGLAAAFAAVLLFVLLTARAPGEFARWLVLALTLLGVLLSVRPAVPAALAHRVAARRMAPARVRDPAVVPRLARVSVLCLDSADLTGTPATLSAAIPAPGRELPDLWLALHRATSAETTGPAEDLALRAAAGLPEHDLPPLGQLLRRRSGPWRAGLHRLGGTTVLTVLGEPGTVLPRCADGDRFTAAVAELTQGGHTVLVLASTESTVDISGDRPPPGLAVVGLLASTETTREATAWRIAALRRAGVQVLLASGGSRAAELAVRCGIGRPAACGLAELVAAQRAAGEVVAALSDRPAATRALLAADVGVAGRGQADLVVSGDRLGALAEAIRLSRLAERNRRAATGFLVAAGGALLLWLAGAVVLLPVAVLWPVHLAWLGVAVAGLASVVAVAPGNPPRRSGGTTGPVSTR